jgi:asparagine synthase (glutamine-hydrolysing)
MCGIISIIRKSDAWEQVEFSLERAASAIQHRGPDGRGYHKNSEWGFANLRLAIVDVTGGNQPIYNDDGTLGIVYNGEIYNHINLRHELEQIGYRFHTHSDTEVILRAYEAYGTDAFRRFNGMFAFCIWDDRTQEIYLVRDHIGIKPLYIYEDPEKIICASEIKGILSIPGVNLEMDPIGIQDYLLFRYVQSPYTLFKNIRCLESGTYARIQGNSIEHLRYWDVAYINGLPKISFEESKYELGQQLLQSVESQLMGEVPIGLLLSGGLDSSAIAYYIKQAGANLMTFNIGFPQVNEFKYSRSVAKSLGLQHTEIVTTVDELNSLFDQVVLALDQPIADPACLPLYRLAQELKQHVTVVLSGEGGDELFAGYPQYSHLIQDNLPYQRRFQRFLERSWYFINYQEFLQDIAISPVTRRHWKYFDEQPLLNGMLAYDMKTWMPENLMMKADKIMMAHSLEGRFPFLDINLFSFAASLPLEYKLNDNKTSKWILKSLLQDILPLDIINRPKMGFTVPVGDLLNRMKYKVINTIANAEKTEIASIIKIDKVSNLAKQFYDGNFSNSLQLWTIFVLLYWQQNALLQYKSSVRLPGRQ